MPSNHWDRDQPLWEHDCESCEFLGNFTVNERFYDLYYHPSVKHRALETFVARYSSDGPDYYSGKDAVLYNPALAMAFARKFFKERTSR